MPATLQTTFNHSLTVVLPVYNEKTTIDSTINTLVESLSTWVPDFEIIVVCDESNDRAKETIKAISASEARVHLLTSSVQRNYEATLVVGFERATKEFILYMDGDGQFDMHDLSKFFPLAADYDGVFGYRSHQKGPLLYKLAIWLWNFVVRFVFGMRVRDVNCAFKLFNAEFFHTQQLETHSTLLITEITYKFARAGYTYTQVPVQHLSVEKSNGRRLRIATVIRSFYDIFFYANKWYNEEHIRALRTQRV